MCRPLTLVFALLIYLAIIGLLVQRLNRMIFVTVGISSTSQPEPIVRVADGQVILLGRPVPLVAVVGSAAIPLVWWLASVTYAANLRRTRERLGQCLECGQGLSAKRGRCPRCGERFECFVHVVPPTPAEFRRTMSRHVMRIRL
ncbi:MAG TPA: hypothetical protein VGR35_21295 [Tepidisphaeraceae bacterium]|nr:hypothetical protein [Tepidisphaeraceae bacterium]